MGYLLIDGLSCYEEFHRHFYNNATNQIYLYLSYLLKSNGNKVYLVDARDSTFELNQIVNLIHRKNISNIVLWVRKNNQHYINQILFRLDKYNVEYDLLSSDFGEIKYLFSDFKNTTRKLLLNSMSVSNCANEICSFFGMPPLTENVKFDYSLLNNVEKKSVYVYTCNNLGINQVAKHSYRNLNHVIDEITCLLSIGYKYFHVKDVEFFDSLDYATEFCRRLKGLHEIGYEFVWSCEIKNISKLRDKNIANSLKETFLVRLVYICDESLPEAEILSVIHRIGTSVLSIVFTDIHLFNAISFTSELTNRCELLLKSANCYVEFYMENNHKKLYSKSEKFNMQQTLNALFQKRQRLVRNYHIKRIEQYYQQIKDYGVALQIEEDIDSAKKQLIDFKRGSEYVYFSWDIEDEILDYSIKTQSPILISNDDRLEDSAKLLCKVLSFSYEGMTIREILGALHADGDNTTDVSDILKSIAPLEKIGMIYFVKYLR